MNLAPAQLLLVIRGLWLANGDSTNSTPKIFTSDAAFRDQLLQALLHCGASPFANLSRKAGAISGYHWHDTTVDNTVYSTKEVHALSETEQSYYTPIHARADRWCVSWSAPASSAGRRSCWPSMRNHTDVTTQPFNKQADGRIWCVEVDSPEHAIIIAQRARRSPTTGRITHQSRAVMVGNCRHVPEYRAFGLEEFVWARLVVITRIFGLVVNGNKTDGLVPMADMLNHKRPRETSWTFDDSRGSFTITSLRPMSRGEQIYDSYGRKCNSSLLRQLRLLTGGQRGQPDRRVGGTRTRRPALRHEVPLHGRTDERAHSCSASRSPSTTRRRPPRSASPSCASHTPRTASCCC